jgi:hypothetical protein
MIEDDVNLRVSLSSLLKKKVACFDKLSMNGNLLMISWVVPFALSPSKGERRVFQQSVRHGHFLRLEISAIACLLTNL